jgi:hypothetical protein
MSVSGNTPAANHPTDARTPCSAAISAPNSAVPTSSYPANFGIFSDAARTVSMSEPW